MHETVLPRSVSKSEVYLIADDIRVTAMSKCCESIVWFGGDPSTAYCSHCIRNLGFPATSKGNSSQFNFSTLDITGGWDLFTDWVAGWSGRDDLEIEVTF